MLTINPRKKISCLLALVFVTIAAALQGQPAEPFIDTERFDFLSLLPDPPEDGSLAGRADLETVLQLQNDRSETQLMRVERVARQDIFSFASPILGPAFNAEALPTTAAFFHEVTQQGYSVAKRAKTHWARPRPHLRDETVTPFPRASRSNSYPSGHSADATTWVVILEELFPGRAGDFEDALREVMWCRVLGGSHYPTDTQGGEILGRAVGQKMLESAAMAAALAEVRSELIESGLIDRRALAM